jgi:Domain of unknown function (DUF4160)
MPRIVRLAAVSIYVYADDHAPPHFHVVGSDTDVQVAIETLQVMRGRYRARDLAEALSWAAGNQALLRAKWSEYNERD